MSRQWRDNKGVREVQCSSCKAFKPATKEYFFFQGKDGCRGPHSWCKPCYASNLGRGRGMRTRVVELMPLPEDVIAAQATFVVARAVGTASFIGAAI